MSSKAICPCRVYVLYAIEGAFQHIVTEVGWLTNTNKHFNMQFIQHYIYSVLKNVVI